MTRSAVLTTGAPAQAVCRPQVIVCHSGKQHAYWNALALQQSGHLEAFVTSSYYKPDSFPDRLAERIPRLRTALLRRHMPSLREDKIVRRWRFELPEMLARATLGQGSLVESLVFRRDVEFDRWIARHRAAAGDMYWGFQGSCLESLRAARRAGHIAIAEFATAHISLAIRILQQEAERHPEWAGSISNLRFPDWYRERLEQEPLEADYCIAASSFTKRSLLEANVAESRIKVLPLGADLSRFQPLRRSSAGKFRILFVGGVGQRKGIKYLLEAYRRMRTPHTELVLAGPLAGDCRALEQYSGLYEHLGRMDQAQVVQEMHRSHVLVLPSVFEGFGLVIPEAMATGMPVIASTHSIGPEIIEEGVDGFVIEPHDVERLAGKLAWMASHRTEVVEMGQLAALKATQFSWDAHARRLTDLVCGIWDDNHSSRARDAQISPIVPRTAEILHGVNGIHEHR